jgi:hypothetical protein
MMRSAPSLGLIALVSMFAADAALCQPSFDIADVHVSPRGDWVKNQTHPMDVGKSPLQSRSCRRGPEATGAGDGNAYALKRFW